MLPGHWTVWWLPAIARYPGRAFTRTPFAPCLTFTESVCHPVDDTPVGV